MKSYEKDGIAARVPNCSNVSSENAGATHPVASLPNATASRTEHESSRAHGELPQHQSIDSPLEKLRATQMALLSAVKHEIERHFEIEFQCLDGQVYLTFLKNDGEITSPYFYPEMELVWYPKWEPRSNRFNVFFVGEGLRLLSVDMIDKDAWSSGIVTWNEDVAHLAGNVEEYVTTVWTKVYHELDKWMAEYSVSYGRENASDLIYDCWKHVIARLPDIAPTHLDVEYTPLDLFCKGHWLMEPSLKVDKTEPLR